MAEYSVTSIKREDGTFEHRYEGERNGKVFTMLNDPFAARLGAEHKDILKLIDENEITTMIRRRE